MMTPETVLKKARNASSTELQKIAESLSGEFISSWLSSSRWKVRNSAVKIIGVFCLTEYRDTIISFITDRTPAKFFDRLFGGDFYQVGFIRRNSVYTLGSIGTPSSIVTSALLTALGDRYWEVRVEALRVFRKLYANAITPEILDAIKTALDDRSFEVIEQALCALSELSDSEDVIVSIRKLYDHPNTLVKMAAAKALKNLHARGLIREKNSLDKELSNIFIPGTYTLNKNQSM